jgi:hypothetical protein
MATPFDSTVLPDGTPAPVFRMDAARAAQHQLAVDNEQALAGADIAMEQRRLAEAAQRHADIQRGEAEVAWRREQSRMAHRAAGDDYQDRIRAAFVEAVRKQAEAAGIPFEEPQPEVITAPEPVRMIHGTGPSLDGSELDNLRERHVRAVIAEAQLLGVPIPENLR